MASDLLITNVRSPDGQTVNILVQGGRIRAVAPDVRAPATMPALDGSGCLALPGGVDMHVHFRTPGASHKEDFASGTAAAVKGGTTTVADMPNTDPPTTTVRALEEKAALAGGTPCHVLFNFGATADNLDEVRRAARHPRVRALKIYVGPSTGQQGLPPRHVEAHVRQAAELDLPVIVHAEDMEMIAANAAHMPHDVWHHAQIRSLEAELHAVRYVLRVARQVPVRVCLAHVTSAKVLDLVEESGLRERVFVEVCPHHLLLSTEDISDPTPNRYKVNPPLRPAWEREALFAALPRRVDGLASDHAPHTLEEKGAPYDEAPSGIPGVEYVFPFAVHWCAEGHYDLARLVALTSGNAARFFGLNTGALAAGCDADIVLVRPDQRWRVAEGTDAVASRCGWTPYAGMSLRGRVVATIAGGRVVYSAPEGG